MTGILIVFTSGRTASYTDPAVAVHLLVNDYDIGCAMAHTPTIVIISD